MTGEMAWLSPIDGGEKILYLRLKTNEPWRPYIAFPQYAIPDYKIDKGTRGWATYQRLLASKWRLVPTIEAERSIKELTEVAHAVRG